MIARAVGVVNQRVSRKLKSGIKIPIQKLDGQSQTDSGSHPVLRESYKVNKTRAIIQTNLAVKKVQEL